MPRREPAMAEDNVVNIQIARLRAAPKIEHADMANLFVQLHENDIRFDHANEAVRVYDRHTGLWAQKRATFGAAMMLELIHTEFQGKVPATRAWAHSAWGAVTDSHRIDCEPSDFDANPRLSGTPGGVYDLVLGAMQPHAWNHFVSRCCAVTPDFAMATPLWDRCLAEWTMGDDSMVLYLQEIGGLALYGALPERLVWVLTGGGFNGKGKFMDALRGAMGSYAQEADASTFIEQRNAASGHADDLARLAGARLVTVSDFPTEAAWNEGRIKKITGGDPLTASFKHKSNFQFQPQMSLLIGCN